MDKLGDHLKRQFQRLSRSTTPEPSPNPAGCPEPPISIAPSIMPTSAGSSSDSVVGPPSTSTGISPILSPQPIIAATTPAFADPPTKDPTGTSISRATWTGLKLFVGVLQTGADVFGPLKQAVDAFAEFVEVYETSMEAHEEYKTLRTELDGLFHDLAGGFGEPIPLGMRSSIVNLARGLEQEISFFRRKDHENTLGRLQDVDQVLYRYRRIHALLERLTLNANLKIWMLVDEQTTSQRLDKLSPSHAGWYNSAESEEIFRDECTPDTRLEVLERFRVWQGDSKSEKVYWLNGMAGTGKTTLAYTLCKQLEDDAMLAGNFFCVRQLPSCRDAKRILPTIAYQLANFSYPFRYALSQILDQNRDVHTRRISEQFEKLLYRPLRDVYPSLPPGLVVVVDGLDECENDRGIGEFLDVLLNHVSDMPIKFFLTSRPDPAIRCRMLWRQGDRDRFELHLHDLDKGSVQDDIRRYLRASLKHHDLTLSEKDLEILTERSGVLFIYAATVVRYISAYEFSRSDDRLKDVLEATTGSSDSDQGISSLYNLILKRAFGDPRLIARERDEMQLVLWTVICAQEPLTARVLAGVLGLKGERPVQAALGLLRSVLNVQKDETITTLHKSLPDHILDPLRSLDFYCDAKKHNSWLAQRCFDLISILCNPPFNVCNQGPLDTLDDIIYLDQNRNQQISGPLFYACRYWVAHLRLTEQFEDILAEIRNLLLPRLILSMEVVNLTRPIMPSRRNMSEWGKRTGWGLVTGVVAVAISLRQYSLALEWLEQGRSILLGHMLQEPALHDDCKLEVVKELQRVLYQPEPAGISGGSLHENAQKNRLAKRGKILEFAKLLPELEDTLRPPDASGLVSLVQDGVAVVLNIDGTGCDALVIQAGTREITHVPLIRFSIRKAEYARARVASYLQSFSIGESQVEPKNSFKDALAMLWYDIVLPLLDHPDEPIQILPADDLPHITWCITDPFSSLPLHAAGDFRGADPVPSDPVISSYTPTISLLNQGTSPPGVFSGMLAIGHTSSIRGLGTFPKAAAALYRVLMNINSSSFILLDGENAYTDAVLKAMANHSWVHFACHGSQNTRDPMKSTLHLHDGVLDLTTIARSPLKHAQLAFLPACDIATGHPGSPEGSAHFATGLLRTGYPAVIATMWSVKDYDAALVAGRVYEHLLADGVPDGRKLARALRLAVAILRERVGVDQFARWVPYVHIGR